MVPPRKAHVPLTVIHPVIRAMEKSITNIDNPSSSKIPRYDDLSHMKNQGLGQLKSKIQAFIKGP